MADTNQNVAAEETAVQEIFHLWSKAVRDHDLDAIRANHHPDMLMFDVPLPFLSQGIDAYMDTWKLFYAYAPKPVKFDFDDVHIHAGSDVAFATATGHCQTIEPDGQAIPLDFRLSMGFRKIDGRWLIVHEHHSLPAVS